MARIGWPRLPRNATLDALLKAGEGVVTRARTAAQTANRFVRWSSTGMDAGKLERLKSVASSGQKLAALMESEGWAELLEAKAHYQALADRTSKQVTVTHERRFQAACEWSALEGFFLELAARVRRGRQAAEEVRKLMG